MTERRQRSGAEWVTFSVCCLILLVLVGTIVAKLRGPQRPATPIASISAIAPTEDGRHRIEVLVTNTGDMTAANVQVVAELSVGERTSTGDQTIDFLAGGEDQELVFYVRDDPAQGELTVEVSGFANP